MGRRVLIIPDIHTEHAWVEVAIAAINPDQVVFLGDYFDSFFTDPSGQQRTAEWLCDSLTKPNRVHLLGNHDAHYAYDCPSLQCSGFDPRAKKAITEVLGEGWGDKLELAHWEGDWLLTHAGLHPSLWPGSQERFLALCTEARHSLKYGLQHPLLNCGKDRGGFGCSGILWLDWHDSFEPIQGIPQIVGHTLCKSNSHTESGRHWHTFSAESMKDTKGNQSWNLDTQCAWLGQLSDGTFDCIKNAWHVPKRTKLKALDSTFWETE